MSVTVYVKKDSINIPECDSDGKQYCIVRTYSAGVFAGLIEPDCGKSGNVYSARRIHYWSGAASISQLAMEGVKNPDDCRFEMEIPIVHLNEIIEIIPCTKEAIENISNVKVWRCNDE